jgi:hypothetical protein
MAATIKLTHYPTHYPLTHYPPEAYGSAQIRASVCHG